METSGNLYLRTSKQLFHAVERCIIEEAPGRFTSTGKAQERGVSTLHSTEVLKKRALIVRACGWWTWEGGRGIQTPIRIQVNGPHELFRVTGRNLQFESEHL